MYYKYIIIIIIIYHYTLKIFLCNKILIEYDVKVVIVLPYNLAKFNFI